MASSSHMADTPDGDTSSSQEAFPGSSGLEGRPSGVQGQGQGHAPCGAASDESTMAVTLLEKG